MTKIVVIFNKQQHALDVDVRDSVEVVRLRLPMDEYVLNNSCHLCLIELAV